MKRILPIALCIAALAGATLAADQADHIWKGNFEPSRITLALKDAKVSEALAAMAKLSGNAPLALPDGFQDKPVSVDLKDVTYFEALDAICKAAGLSYEPVKDVLTLGVTEKPRDAGEYCGAGTVKVIQVAKLNSFRDASWPDSRSLWMTLGAFWEDRLPVVADACLVTRAATDDGRDLPIRQQRAGQAMIGPYTDQTKGPVSARQVMARFQNVPDKGDSKTFQLEGKYTLALGSGEKTLAIPNLLGGKDLSAEDKGITFKVTKVQKLGGAFIANMGGAKPGKQQLWISIEITRDGGLVAMGNGSPYGIILIDPDGKRYPAQSVSGMAQAKGNAWTASLNALFEKPEKMDETWSIAYVYPEKQETKEWTFRIKDVPLP